jgi:ComF family protein
MLDLILPHSCLLCGLAPIKNRENVCDSCWSAAETIRSPHCSCCLKPFDQIQGDNHLCGECMARPKNFHRHFTGGAYKKVLRELIHQAKFSEREEAVTPLVHFFLQQEKHEFDPTSYDLLTCVPTTPRRLWRRGVHLAAYLAQRLGSIYRCPTDIFLLKKTRETKPQSDLKERERWTNVHGAFAVGSPVGSIVKRVLLIDDVYTTGATLSEGTRTLKQAGVTHVDVLTLARGV